VTIVKTAGGVCQPGGIKPLFRFQKERPFGPREKKRNTIGKTVKGKPTGGIPPISQRRPPMAPGPGVTFDRQLRQIEARGGCHKTPSPSGSVTAHYENPHGMGVFVR